MTTEVQLNGTRYVLGKLSAMQQFHVSRRIAPIIPPMIPVLMKFYAELEQADVAREQARANAALAALEEAGGTEAQSTAPLAPEADRSRELLSLVDAIAPVLQPFADALAGLKDEDAEYVFGTCLSVVERWQGAGWAKVWNIAHKTAMFDDIGIDVMLPLVVRVVVANLGNFIQGLLFQPGGERDLDSLDWRSLPGGEDWLLYPVTRGMCRYESLKDGTLDLADVALMNDVLAVQGQNQALIQEHLRRAQEGGA